MGRKEEGGIGEGRWDGGNGKGMARKEKGYGREKKRRKSVC